MKLGLFVLLLFTFSTLNAGQVNNQAAAIAALSTAHQAEKAEQELVFDSPKATLDYFIKHMKAASERNRDAVEVAAETFDLTDVSSLLRHQKGIETANLLYAILAMDDKVNPNVLPSHPERDSYILVSRKNVGDVELVFKDEKTWLFSAESVEIIPALFEQLTDEQAQKRNLKDEEIIRKAANAADLPLDIRLRAFIPNKFRQDFLLEYWQWIGLVVLFILGWTLQKIFIFFLRVNVQHWQKRLDSYNFDKDVLSPLGLMAMALVWWLGLKFLGLPDTLDIIFTIAVKVVASISGVWAAFRLVDILNALLIKRVMKSYTASDELLVPMITKALKLMVSILGFVFVADNLNVDVSSLIAGLGLGGLAFALAAKDLAGNFVGSLTVLMDKPFRIGDWVKIEDIEGTVEEVGFRSTRIRTFYNSLITVPNALMTTTKIDNMGERRYRRMKQMLSLTYNTPPEKIEAFCEGVRRIIQMHPYMRKDMYEVYFNGYGAASLDILVYVFWATPDWNMELRERHRFLLDILRLAKQLEVEFAYPTQTLYLKRGDIDSPAASEFKPDMTEEQAKAIGRKQAEAIVSQTLGDKIPGPVEFPR